MKVALIALHPRLQAGLHQYTVTLIDALCELAEQGAVELAVVQRGEYDGEVAGRARITVSLTGFKSRLETRWAPYAGTGIAACRAVGFDVAVSPRTCLVARNSGRTSVVTIHDLQHRRLPHFFSRPRRVLREWLYRQAAETADGIVCETAYVKRDIMEFYGVAADRIHIVPCPPPSYVRNALLDPDQLTAVRQKYRLPTGYLFYPAQFWPHKNHLMLIDSLGILKATFGVDVPLVLVGAPLQSFGPTMQRVRELGLEERVHYLGYVPDDEMPYLYRAAAALVVPSLFESLSIPVWEAFHLGVPVVCANTGAFPDQVGAAALTFDPSSPQDCAAKINACLTNQAVARSLVARGRERVGELTLARYAEQWKGVLDRVVGN